MKTRKIRGGVLGRETLKQIELLREFFKEFKDYINDPKNKEFVEKFKCLSLKEQKINGIFETLDIKSMLDEINKLNEIKRKTYTKQIAHSLSKTGNSLTKSWSKIKSFKLFKKAFSEDYESKVKTKIEELRDNYLVLLSKLISFSLNYNNGGNYGTEGYLRNFKFIIDSIVTENNIAHQSGRKTYAEFSDYLFSNIQRMKLIKEIVETKEHNKTKNLICYPKENKEETEEETKKDEEDRINDEEDRINKYYNQLPNISTPHTLGKEYNGSSEEDTTINSVDDSQKVGDNQQIETQNRERERDIDSQHVTPPNVHSNYYPRPLEDNDPYAHGGKSKRKTHKKRKTKRHKRKNKK
jgi:hypothetical protein